MLNCAYKILFSQEMGRGVYAARNIEKSELIEACEILILSPQDSVALEKTDLKYYTFKLNSNQDCLVLGCGELFNHSDSPNVSYSLETEDGRLKMLFKSLESIKSGEQLLIDYSADVKVDASSYINNKSLIF